MSKSQLMHKINAVNSRSKEGLNVDDQVAAMIEEDATTKGWSYLSLGETYRMISDVAKLKLYVKEYRYWSDEVKKFNSTLTTKGGLAYMETLNQPYINKHNSTKSKS